MVVKLGRWHWGRNVDWGCLKIGCSGEYLGRRGRGDRGVEKIHDEEFNDLSSSPNMFGVTKSRRMRWAGHVARVGLGDAYTWFWWGNLKERDQFGGPGLDGKIILKWIFGKWNVGVWTGSNWLRMRTGGGHLWLRKWTFGFHKTRRISWLAENLLASQEGLCSKEK